jgi:hypothetical protein
MNAIFAFVFITLCNVVVLAADTKAVPDDSMNVTVVGILRTGVVAIGGETTGITVKAEEMTWELDLGKNEEFIQAAKKLNSKKVVVQGKFERRPGVEVKERWIVIVIALQEIR